MLAYLVLAKPRGLHSRDTLVAMLWPESDQAGGRHALRNVLHAIRQALGNEIVSTAGDGMVGVSFERIDCDAIELEEDLEAGRIDSAIRRYHGELLQGFHVSEAPEFERWLDGERRRLSDAVLAAGWLLADTKLKAGEVGAGLAAARRAVALAPDDEVLLRRFLRFLDDVGDRFGAERAYEEFSARLKTEYGAEPSAETQALARALRESPSAGRVRHPNATAAPLVVTRPVAEDAPVSLLAPAPPGNERGKRLERSYTRGLEKLAERAEAAGNHAAAVRWWRKLTEADPVSSTYAAGLIRALMNTGDHASALQYADRYEALVAQELGSTAGPAVANLVAQVRAAARSIRLRPAEIPVGAVAAREPLESGSGSWVSANKSVPATTEFVIPGARAPTDPPEAAAWWRKRAVYWPAAILAIVVVVAVVVRSRETAPADAPRPSIAVLPFANVSRTPEDAVFVDGLTEELIGVLARIRGLRVIARTSAFAFRDSHADVRRIADSLGVSNIVEGSVERVGSRLRIQVRLADGRDGSTRWSEMYDRETRDAFAVQSEIAGAVARALDVQLGSRALAAIQHGTTSNVAAHELYLRGSDVTLMRSDSAANAGLKYLQQAISLDPNYAQAYASLARVTLRSPVVATGRMPLRGRVRLAEQAALKAVALDDSLGEAHAALSLVRKFNYDMASAETEMKRAVDLDPNNSRFHELLAQLYVVTGRREEALFEGRRAIELDPMAPTAVAEFARALAANDQCDEALGELAKLRSLRPPLLRAGTIAAECYARKKMWPHAIAELQRNQKETGAEGQAWLGNVLARAGRTDDARRILAGLMNRTSGAAGNVALIYAGLGENDQAFVWLDKALAERSVMLHAMGTLTEELHTDPRFEGFRRRLGLQKR